jgi:HAE1 family hydrophobic/amphiphilic exporter-1
VALYGGSSLAELRRLAEERLRLDLESLEGVAAVQVEGGLEEEIHVEVETARLARLGLSLNQVTGRLAAENVNLTGGLLKDGEAEFLVRTLNEFREVEEIGEIAVGQSGPALVKLKDVAQVRQGFREREVIARIGGREGVALSIFKEGDANTVQVHQAVLRRLDTFAQEYRNLLGESRIELVADQATFIRQSVDEVLNTALIGGTLAVLILYLFLRNLKSTAIISLSIPISVVATFFLMFASGVTLNIMSLGGLALGVGMLVDNSIVVLENIQRHRDQGLSILEAARVGSQEVGTAVSASTLTTICVFLPIVFVEGVAGQLFGDQSLTVTYSLVASLVVALMLIPMLSSLSLEPPPAGERPARLVRGPARVLRGGRALWRAAGRVLGWLLWPFSRSFAAGYGWCASFYPRILGWSLDHRLKLLAGVSLIAGLVFYQARTLGLELIPELSQGEILVDLEWPAGTPLELTARQVEAIDTRIRDLEGVQTVFGMIGASGQAGGYADEKKEHRAQLYLRLRPGSSRQEEERVIEQVRADLEAIPDLDHKFSRPSYFSFRTPVEVEVYGENLQTLRLLAEEVRESLARIPGLADVRSSAAAGQPEIQIEFDRQRVAELGTDIQAIGQLLRNALQGDVATELPRQERRIEVRVRATENERQSLEELERLVVSPPGYPVPVPLEAVAGVEVVEGPAEIHRLDQERVAIVSANLSGRDLGGAVRQIEAALARIPVPEGFSIAVGGQNEEMVRSFDSLKFALLLAAFLVYLVMASQFESLLHPLVIMFTIPLGLVGSFLALLLTGHAISVVVLIGLVMLAGIVVNNAIILVTYINQLRRHHGLAKLEAVKRAGELRLRPILMTTSTTILGLLPMALGLGEGAEIRAPMALTVIGGLALSTLLTLVVIPVVYTLLDRRS